MSERYKHLLPRLHKQYRITTSTLNNVLNSDSASASLCGNHTKRKEKAPYLGSSRAVRPGLAAEADKTRAFGVRAYWNSTEGNYCEVERR